MTRTTAGGAGTPTVEMHAVQADTGEQHVVRVPADDPSAEFRCAVGLAGSVGVELEG